jgi:hypothetical protein
VATRKRLPPPKRTPIREFKKVSWGRMNEEMSPTPIPGRLITSGIIW